MPDALTRATYRLHAEDLQWMVLEQHQLPDELREFELLRERELDNATMAAYGFPGNTSDYFRQIGRITGYEREYASAFVSPVSEEGTDVMAATVAHLFDDEEAVSLWMTEVFVKQFEENVGKSLGADQNLESVERVSTSGFHDEAVGLRSIQSGPDGLVSSTVIDFRVGRLLGVAFVVTIGDRKRQALTERLAAVLERQMVQHALSSD